LESSGDTLNTASRTIFSDKPRGAKGVRDTDMLRDLMKRIGRASEHMSIVRYTLVCLVRMSHYVEDRAHDWIAPPCIERLQAVRADIASLEQYEENLLSRIQLLQDAATAFISIEQNEVVKVLTIASVVGIPPVLIVGIYGMNFKDMPELSWTYGYPYAIALIVVSMIVPLVWFKIKDWM
jgi:magnesium transporter